LPRAICAKAVIDTSSSQEFERTRISAQVAPQSTRRIVVGDTAVGIFETCAFDEQQIELLDKLSQALAIINYKYVLQDLKKIYLDRLTLDEDDDFDSLGIDVTVIGQIRGRSFMPVINGILKGRAKTKKWSPAQVQRFMATGQLDARFLHRVLPRAAGAL
jgi:hypothetical protein